VLLHRGYSEYRLLPNLLGLGLAMSGAILLLAAPLLPILARYLSGEYVVSPQQVLLGMLLLPPLLLAEYLRALLAARRDLRAVAVSQGVQAAAQLGFALLLVLLLGLGAIGAVWATVLAGLAGLVWTLYAVAPLGSLLPRLQRSVLRPLLGLGLRGHVGNVVQTFNYRLDLLLVQGFLGQASVGLYFTAVALAELVWYLPNAVAAALLPEVAASHDRALTGRVARITLPITVLGAFGLLAIAWPAFALLRPAYLPAIAPMAVLLVGVVVLSLHKVLASDLSGRGLPQYPSISSSVALGVTLVADLVLIPWLGIVGAALASTLAYTAQTVLLTVIWIRRGGGWRELVPRRSDAELVLRRIGRGSGARS
jgi:O-antigen/teichoic acid export membrane protein